MAFEMFPRKVAWAWSEDFSESGSGFRVEDLGFAGG